MLGCRVIYRPEIDGLRALAVMCVFLFHLGVTFADGGYVGVDIFFVISGYLITNIIYKELNGASFSIGDFYERRVRRLAPSLIFILTGTIIAGLLYLHPDDLIALSKSVIGTSLFASNILFYRQSVYFDTASELKPLLHTWSLSVEEQFYLIFPLIMVFLYKFYKKNLPITIACLTVCSFIICIWSEKYAPAFGFFLPFTRSWEFLIGSLIALRFFPVVKNQNVNQGLAGFGLALIMFSVIIYTNKTPFPGIAALAPVAGSTLLIYCANGTFVGRILSMRPIVYIGLISYPLYLVHWPIIVIIKYVSIDTNLESLTPVQTTIAIVSSLLISSFMLHFVERPFRNKLQWKKSKIFAVALAAFISIIGVSTVFIITKGLDYRLSQSDRLAYNLDDQILDFQANPCLIRDGQLPKAAHCMLGVQNSALPVTAAFWGDSQAAHLAPAIDAAGKISHTKVKQYTKAGCGPILARAFAPADDMLAQCATFNESVLADIRKQPDINILFVASQWESYVNGERLALSSNTSPDLDGSRKLLVATLIRLSEEMQDRGGRLVVISPTPIPRLDVNVCLRAAQFNYSTLERCEFYSAAQSRRNAASFENVVIQPALKGEAVFSIIDLFDLFCNDHICRALDGGGPLLMDDVHLSSRGASRVIPKLVSVMRAPRPHNNAL